MVLDIIGCAALWAFGYATGTVRAHTRQVKREIAALRAAPVGHRAAWIHRTTGHSVSITSSIPANLNGDDWVRVDDTIDRLDAAHDAGEV